MARTVDYKLFHLPKKELMDYIASWRKFLNELTSLFGVDWRRVFGTDNVQEILLGVCRGKTDQECRMELARIMLEKAEELGITRPHEVPKTIRRTLMLRAAIPTTAPTPAAEAEYRIYTYVRAPPTAEEYLLEELGALGIQVMEARSPNVYIAMLRLRAWCSQNGKPIEIGNVFPTNYAGIRLFYFRSHKPRVCFLERKEDKIVFYGCDKPVVVIAWNDKCILNSFESIVE